MNNPRQRTAHRLYLGATAVLVSLAALLFPTATTAAAASAPTSAPAAVRTVGEPHCGGEWVNYNGAENRRMKSWLCLYDSGSGGIYPTLWTECGWWQFIGWADPPNGCRIWEPSSYEITFPDGTKTKDALFPGASGKNSAASNGSSYPCQEGAWKLWSYYGVQMKDVLGNWGSGVEGTHEFTFNVTCP
ncbi:hypothetical protein GCM10010387_12410 [Streptomyces inusitatus]|uniref:Secreted protein n=1 Tax=Streptomyces inusitatus TaxID=68221 RepID=A0A918UMM0_9ACTN|nr:hypothetical protein [Streptomyces inusitatus]GGZ20933.1 hypothetical protein GCM10010387_12410 [Streptomyces inusitatus]